MPPIVLFNKVWRVASDDFVYPSIVEILTRGGWAVALGFVLGFHVQELDSLVCLGREYRYTTSYLIAALVIQLVTSVNLVYLCYYSSRGRIFDTSDPHPRRLISKIIYINIILTCLEFSLTCYGAFFAIKDLMRCMSEERFRVVIIIIIVVILLTYILLFIKMALAITTIKPFSLNLAEEERHLLANREHVQHRESQITYRGLRCLMPCSNDEGTIQAFQDISELFSKIFHDHDLVPSDILAGLLLLHYKHKLEKEVGSTLTSRNSLRSQDLEVDVDDMSGLKYFYKYSMAAYGCWWYVMDSPCTHCCSLGSYIEYCPCFPCMQPEDRLVEGDGCFQHNHAAAKAKLKMEDESFIVFDNRNRIQEVPYFMYADRERKSLVIAIRGTLSISDMFTDLRGEPGHLADCEEVEFGIDPTFKGHKGMVAAASYVYRRLHGLPVSQRKKNDQVRSERVEILRQTLEEFQDIHLKGHTYPLHYKFVLVTGHSLGAGTASILAFMLRAKYPDRNIICYAYSPPGGLLSPAAATESEKFTLSLVVGDDEVGRLLTQEQTVNRTTILDTDSSEDTRSPLTPSSPGSGVQLLDIPAIHQQQCQIQVHPSCEPMYLPGRIYYIEDLEDGSFHVSRQNRTIFNTILVSPRMMADHMPNYIQNVLDQV
ncbi:sn1-specific diacylglycerol lipase beta-like [Eurytemora carolleeae]|uniref:sn1-specific diacylglycerol lipase beta-like n=1 Tax=Eurytemora carolleeae TaxID=1294199 RepID=UPI000C77B828|nr:sn1-specific diacylglycerol lipase beta-like [Eurytemora carolleeae]|eukprot:XP_023332335.1 sn1-specific diacylglycerol lipase beta-like [Eurytemora affinis]